MSNRPKNSRPGKGKKSSAQAKGNKPSAKEAEKYLVAGMLYKLGCDPLEYVRLYSSFAEAEEEGVPVGIPTLFEMLEELSGEKGFAEEVYKEFMASPPDDDPDAELHILPPSLLDDDKDDEVTAPAPDGEMADKTLTLRIQLDGMKKPPLYRVVKVKGDITFGALHSIIQVVMGWDNSHLHSFSADGFTIGQEDEDDGFDMTDLNEDETRISSFLNEVGAKARYEYDFGDGWEHTIKVEAIEDGAIEHPVLIKTKGGQVTDDCGGIWGLQELRDIVASKGRLSEEERERMEWMGASSRADLASMITAESDINSINVRLSQM